MVSIVRVVLSEEHIRTIIYVLLAYTYQRLRLVNGTPRRG